MNQAAAALRAAVAALLDAQGEPELARTVRDAEVEVLPPETWAMGARTVQAHRVAIALEAGPFSVLSGAADRVTKIRTAFEAAMRSPETELADIALLLKLPSLGVAWRHAYRDVPPHELAERPDDTAVVSGAAALLAAQGDADAAAILERAELESADVPSSGGASLRRWVARLDPADLVRAQHDTALADRLRRALASAATRASEVVASVELAAALAPPPGAGHDPESLLTRALGARGARVTVVSRSPGLVTLACVKDGELCLVEIAPAARAISTGESRVRRVSVDEREMTDEAAAERVGALLWGEAPATDG